MTDSSNRMSELISELRKARQNDDGTKEAAMAIVNAEYDLGIYQDELGPVTRQQLVETLADMADAAARNGIWRERWTQVADSAIAELEESHHD